MSTESSGEAGLPSSTKRDAETPGKKWLLRWLVHFHMLMIVLLKLFFR